MRKRILITGGAGFIGSHAANEMLNHGYRVRALDSLVAQVHGPERRRPEYLSTDVELIVGDVRDPVQVEHALEGVDFVLHLAALVGVGQSMYAAPEYVSTNSWGTTVLLNALSSHPVECLLVASSMSIYGEGLYRGVDGRIRSVSQRTIEQLKMGDWELRDECGMPLTPVPTPEGKEPCLASVYALSKYDQERLCLIMGGAYRIPSVALRFFNTYGPHQALSNPYTGVLSNFASRILNGQAPLIFEDGLQKRDLVSVYDVARACRLAMETPAAWGRVLNIGSGIPVSIREVASRTIATLGRSDIEPAVTGKYRAGDIRHCFGDVSLARRVLGWEPKISLEQGLLDLAEWLDGQTAVDRGLEARAELAVRGLMI